MSAPATQIPTQAPPQGPSPGWYLNPEGPGQRYWDGTQWTDRYNPAGPPAKPPRQGRGKTFLVIAGVIAALAALGAALYFGVVRSADNEQRNAANRAANTLDTAMVGSYSGARRCVGAVNSAITFDQNMQAGLAGIGAKQRLRETSACIAKIGREQGALRRAWVAAPAYVQLRYRSAYRAERRFLLAAKRYMRATAAFARAGYYSGADRANRLGLRDRAAGRRFERALRTARAKFDRYAEQL